MMDIEVEIKEVLFKMGQEIKIHKIDNDNSILEVDYEKYTAQLLRVFMNYLAE
jgi:hypothetical protein